MSTPWFPLPPVWDWPGISADHADRARAYFVRQADRLESQVSGCRHIAEARAYALCIEKMHDLGIFSTDHISELDVVRQVRRAELFARHDAIGRRIAAGTWPKRDGKERMSFLTEEDLGRVSEGTP